MGRPPGYQWQPLGLDTDPVPGDPQAVSAEAAHLASVAATITGQVAVMHKIAGENTETGQHAETIRAAARRQASSLQAVAVRYARVSSALSGWAPELEQAQAMSIRALNEAEIPYAALNRAVSLPSGPDLTAAQQQQITDYHASMRRAQEQLDAARALLTRATALRDTQAAYYAAKINQASNDSLTDHESLWGDITSGIDHLAADLARGIKDTAWLIKDVCVALEVVAAALAVIALFATGIGWLLVAAFALTATALFFRTLLAATGNGSWADVAVDVVALATLGIGGGISGTAGLVGRAGRTLGEAVGVGDRIVTAERAASFSARVSRYLGQTAEAIQDARVIPDVLARPFTGAAKLFDDYNRTMRPLASTMVKGAEETSAWARIFSGGEEPANYVVRMRMLLARFPDSPQIAQLGEKFSAEIRTLRTVVGAGVANTGASMAANGGVPVSLPDGGGWQFWHVGPWDRLEETTTHALPGGDTIAYAMVGSVIW
jgi:hypothetical protein